MRFIQSIPTGSLRVAPRPETRSSESPVLSLVVPTYNEAVNIGPFLKRIRSLLDPPLGSRYEVIVVDDNSPDETWKVAGNIQACYPQLVVLRREQERGLSERRHKRMAGRWRRDPRHHQRRFPTPSGIVAEDAGNGSDRGSRDRHAPLRRGFLRRHAMVKATSFERRTKSRRTLRPAYFQPRLRSLKRILFCPAGID